jgi:hypothetical protein
MSDFKMKQEIKTLIKMGFNEEMATLVVAAKYGKLEMASDIVSGIADENEAIKEALVDFKPYVQEDTTGIIVSSSSSPQYPLEYINDDDTENLNSNDIQEKADDKNENENL